MASYKTSASDAQAMVNQWYTGLIGHPPSADDLSWWTKQIQQDGSHTAFLNLTKAAQDSGNGQILATNAAKYKASTGLDPWQPDAKTPQFGGSNNTSVWDAINPLAQVKAAAQGNWSEALMPDPVNQLTHGDVKIAAPILDTVATIYGGPLGGAAAGALNSALQPGSNLATDAAGAATGLATGAAGKGIVKGVGGLFSGGSSAPSSMGDFDSSGNLITPAASAAAPGSASWLSNLLGSGGSVLSGLLPKTSDGSIDWSKLLTSVAGVYGGVQDYNNKEAATQAEKDAQQQAINARTTNLTGATTMLNNQVPVQTALGNVLRARTAALPTGPVPTPQLNITSPLNPFMTKAAGTSAPSAAPIPIAPPIATTPALAAAPTTPTLSPTTGLPLTDDEKKAAVLRSAA